MKLLKIEKRKCKKDGICAKECPVAIIRLEGEDSYPRLIPGSENVYLVCGHCLAVCPHGAIRHARVRIEDCATIKKELMIGE